MNPFHLPAQVSRGYLAGQLVKCLFSAPFLNAALEKGEKRLKKKKEKRLTTAMSQTDERFKYTVIQKLL